MGIVHRGIPHAMALRWKREREFSNFIETGTLIGKTTRWAADRFEWVYGIELDEGFLEKTKRRCWDVNNVKLYHGDSGKMLREVLKEVAGPSLIWLDAHWSRDLGYGVPEVGPCPVMREMQAIIDDRKLHVVLIDDARLFIDPPNELWPTIDELTGLALEGFSHVRVSEDVIQVF